MNNVIIADNLRMCNGTTNNNITMFFANTIQPRDPGCVDHRFYCRTVALLDFEQKISTAAYDARAAIIVLQQPDRLINGVRGVVFVPADSDYGFPLVSGVKLTLSESGSRYVTRVAHSAYG